MLPALEIINVRRCYFSNSSLSNIFIWERGRRYYWQGEYPASHQCSPTLVIRGDKRGTPNSGAARYRYTEKTRQMTAAGQNYSLPL